jgi:membrane protein implicated in regulation of membrane protease activity
MNMTDLLALTAVFLQIIGMTVAAVWAIATIRSTTTNLKQTIDNLAKTVGRVGEVMDDIQERSHDHEVRLSVIEQQLGKHYTGD